MTENPVVRMTLEDGARRPVYGSDLAAGADLCAFLPLGSITIKPMERVAVPTGMRIALDRGYEAQVRPRSGLALKYGITVLNSPGTVDADYRGEVKVILINLSDRDFVINDGDRIAQLIVSPCCRCQFINTESLDHTQRGSGGFGSTGI